ncbi:MAG: CvpA family protein [Lachnospiraceae bacterium]|nr:CvpA family protein [Lachnospiraceae bacterium]
MAAEIVIAAIIIISTVQGLKNGGLRTFWSIGCSVAAIILAIMLNPAISDFMTNQVHLNQYIEANVREYLEEQAESSLEDAQKDIQNQYIKELEIPSSWKKTIIKNNTEEGHKKLLAEGFFEYVSGAIAAISVKVLAFILTFILVAVILKMISIMFGIIEKIPGLSHVNKLVGIGAGFVRSFIIIWLIMIVIAFAGNYQWGQVLLKLVLDNPVAAFFYHHNLLAMAFLSIF